MAHISSLSSMARSLKVAVFLVSTAAESVGVKGICSVASVSRGAFWPTIYADVSVNVVVENKTRSNLVRLVGKMLSCRHTSGTCLVLRRRVGRRHLHIRDHLANVPFDHKHDIRFSLSVLPVAFDGPRVFPPLQCFSAARVARG